MSIKIEKLIAKSFYLLFFFVPLVLYPYTFEVFEFNKMVLVYIFTIVITSLWLARSLLAKKIIFKRTILNIPLLIFLATQIISTLLSVDVRTSLLGYYSRFHGGLLSSICYSFLYWAWVSNMNREKTLKAIYVIFSSAILVSIYAILQHFGIDKDVWVQDVQNRVFSTLGQPNWLAAWMVALMPLTWAFALNSKLKTTSTKGESTSGWKNGQWSMVNGQWLWILLSTIFFLVLLYTKSRSGLLGFLVATTIFWGLLFIQTKRFKFKLKGFWKLFLIPNSLFVILALLVGTPWTPNLNEIFNHQPLIINHSSKATIPALEIGGSKSTEIRKIVWKGTLDIWKAYPIFGSGVETFAFSYYNFRPVEHNLVSEWDFLYNKAHNEYLNFLATTGVIGTLSYIMLILASLYQISKSEFLNSKQTPNSKFQLGQSKIRSIRNLNPALTAGFSSILVTNFFGFSVVPVALFFFLYPAFATSLEQESRRAGEQEPKKLDSLQKILLVTLYSFTLLLFYSISKYYLADLAYSKAKIANDSSEYILAKEKIQKALKLSPNEAIFWNELSQIDTNIAVALSEEGNAVQATKFAEVAARESIQAIQLSPANVNLKRERASMFIKLSIIEPDLLIYAESTLEQAVLQAPTSAKLFYNLALANLRTGESTKAIKILQKTIEMKPNYRNAHYALGLIYVDENQTELAKQQFKYILENIEPADTAVQRELDEISN